MATALWFTCLVLLSQLDLHAVLGVQCMGGGYPQTPPPYPIMVKSNNDNGLNSLMPLLLLQLLTDNGNSGCGSRNGCGCGSSCGNGCGCRSGNGCGCGSGSGDGCGCGGGCGSGCGSGSGGGCGSGSGYRGGCSSGNGCGCCNNYPVPIPYNPPCNSVVVN